LAAVLALAPAQLWIRGAQAAFLHVANLRDCTRCR